MFEKTPFVILRKFPFGERGVVLHVFTKTLGRIPILIKSARSKKSPLPYGMMRPLFPFEALLVRSRASDFYMIKEAKPLGLFDKTVSDPYRTALAFFIADVWSHAVKEEGSQEALFSFMHYVVETLEEMESGLAYFHHWVLMRTAYYLGFSPGASTLSPPYFFDLINGDYLSQPPAHPYSVSSDTAEVFSYLCQFKTFPEQRPPGWSSISKRESLQQIMNFYRLHIDGFKMPVSLEVLMTL
ncbi:MAG: recombination protein O N-terminal domain-containing protein [Cryomorphaceae bacterium]|nr:recombination protein O N-terminal domain-containing protein [Cryomorphaceae bacterium]